LSELFARVDLVDVCTPTDTHAEIARAAIAAGIPVICEKPLTRDSATARDLVDAAARAGVGLYPAHVVRYVGAYERLREVAYSGELGRPVFARFTRVGQAPTWGGWFADPIRSGGIILDQTIHDIDQALATCGPVASVHARLSSPPDAATASALLVLTHTNGAISHVVGVWGPPHTPFRTTYRVVGTRATVEHDSDDVRHIRIRGAQAPEAAQGIPDDAGEPSPFEAELADLLNAALTGAPARVDAEDGVAAVAVAEAAIRSALEGETVILAARDTIGVTE
jgi:predicted dehydrogenase